MPSNVGRGHLVVLAVIVTGLSISLSWAYFGTQTPPVPGQAPEVRGRVTLPTVQKLQGAPQAMERPGRFPAGDQELPVVATAAEQVVTPTSKSQERITLLKKSRELFELELGKEFGDPVGSALDLLALGIVSELDLRGRFRVISPGEKTSLAGSRIPEGEVRIAFGDRLYSFQESEYPTYASIRALMAGDRGEPTSKGYPKPQLSPELLVDIQSAHENALQVLGGL